jgi:hypothetical protein
MNKGSVGYRLIFIVCVYIFISWLTIPYNWDIGRPGGRGGKRGREEERKVESGTTFLCRLQADLLTFPKGSSPGMGLLEYCPGLPCRILGFW